MTMSSSPVWRNNTISIKFGYKKLVSVLDLIERYLKGKIDK